MLERDTEKIQHKLAKYCRTGEETHIEGARNSRLHHYRRLVKNVINSTMKHAYPITREVLGKEQWDKLISLFFTQHDPQTPKVWELPYELCEFVKENDIASALNLPILEDLMYLEWIEIQVHTMEDEDIPDFTSDGDLLSDTLVINPEHVLIRLEYPVHKLSAGEAGKKKGNYFVMVFREPESGRVRFINLSVLFVYLLNRIKLEGKPAISFADDIMKQFNIRDRDLVFKSIEAFLDDMIKQEAILGFKANVRH